MMIQSKKSLTLAAAAILGVSALAPNVRAEHDSYRIQQQIEEKVYLIDRLADQMAWRYGWEVRRHRGCQHSLALYSAMRTHTGLTNNLVRASRGTCKVTFKRAACAVRENLNGIQRLRQRAQVSNTVCALIRQSCPPSTFVHQNAHRWNPTPVFNRGGSCNSGGGYTNTRQVSPYSFILSRFGF